MKLVKEYSEEPTSKAKDGDFGTFHGSDNIPEPTRSMVMALKTGEVSDPVRQPNGVYLFRAEEVLAGLFDKVSEEIFTQLRQQRSNSLAGAAVTAIQGGNPGRPRFAARPRRNRNQRKRSSRGLALVLLGHKYTASVLDLGLDIS